MSTAFQKPLRNAKKDCKRDAISHPYYFSTKFNFKRVKAESNATGMMRLIKMYLQFTATN